MVKNLTLFFTCVFVFSCANMADDKVPEIADDYCKCFSAQEKKISNNTKDFFKLIAEGENDEEVLAEERNKLSAEEQEEVQDLALMFQNKNSKLGKCIARVNKKMKGYKTKDQGKFYDKLIEEMEGRKNCKVMSYILTMGKRELAKGKGKKTDEDEEETTEE